MADSPQDQEFDFTMIEDISPLRQLTIESHEMYKELCSSGFPSSSAEKIVAHILYAYTTSRFDEDDDDDDFEDMLDDGDDS